MSGLKDSRQIVLDAMRRELTNIDMALECVWPAVPDEAEIARRIAAVEQHLQTLKDCSAKPETFAGQPNPGAGIPTEAETGRGNCSVVDKGGGYNVISLGELS